MDTVTLVAKILAIYLIVSGLFLVFKKKSFPFIIKDFLDHPAVMYLSGIILIFLSSIYLLQYNIWDGTWKTVVTVLVWLIGLKGLSYLFIPSFAASYYKNNKFQLIRGYGVVAIAAGIYMFCWMVK